MKRSTRRHRLLAAGIIAAAVSALPLAQAAHAGPEPPEVPELISVPDGNKVFLVAHAIGVQIYSCNASGSTYAWAPVGPSADLYDGRGRLVASHYGGPTWEGRDGSTVVGQVDERVSVDPTAIPWLRLSRASTTVGPDGDLFANTSFIQRIETTGGVAPAAATCHAGTVGAVEEVPYTADYVFWKASGR